MRKIFNNFTKNPKDDILSGITVSLAMIPEVVAFAFVIGIDPLVALSGAFMIGLITALFGGRPGLISGAAGAVAVIFADLIIEGHEKGLAMEVPVDNMQYIYLFAAVILMGIIQVLAGVFKVGKFVRLIPHPVMMGFVNGLAIVIFWAQIKMFRNRTAVVDENGVTDYVASYMQGSQLYIMIGLVALTMAIVFFLPKLTKKIPAALTAIIVVTAIVILGDIEGVSTVGSYIRDGGGTGLKGELPTFNTELWEKLPLGLETFKFILPYAFLAAAVGLIESLMTMNLVDELTETRGSGNRECVAQGAGNIVSGLFGGTGGCGMIGQTVININAGGRGRLSGVMMSLTLLVFLLFTDQYIEQVPIAALVGVMFMMVIETFAWSSFRILGKIPKSDALVLIIVSVVTVVFDLAIAVFVGVIISALVFAWESAKRIRARKSLKEDGTKVYEIWGPLFFGSVTDFNMKFDSKNDPDKVEIDFIEARVQDHSGIEALRGVANKYLDLGKEIKLTHLSPECKQLLIKNNPEFETIIESSIEDPRYHIATDLLDAEV